MSQFFPIIDTQALRRALCGSYSLDVTDTLTVLHDRLPGRTVAAAAMQDGHLYVVQDTDKAMAPRHARALLRECAHLLLGAPAPVMTKISDDVFDLDFDDEFGDVFFDWFALDDEIVPEPEPGYVYPVVSDGRGGLSGLSQ